MKLAVILPRRMHFGPDGATAIDLCARDFVTHSTYRSETRILGEPVERPFEGLDFRAVGGGRSKAEWARLFARAAMDGKPDLVIVHQHLEIAAAIARRIAPVPVIFHRHNFPGDGNWLKRRWHTRRYAKFARTIWVSETCERAYRTQYPELSARARVVHNGLDLEQWHPQPQREQVVLCVGRASPEKGILEGALGAVAAIEDRPDWRARFILSRIDRNDDYLRAVAKALAPLGGRAEILADQRHDVIRLSCERAAIALVPSKFPEPFGRTAIEALAGGAALVASQAGALGEVAADAAVPVDATSPPSIARALVELIEDPARRARFAACGRERVAKLFDVRSLARRLDAIYDEVVVEKGTAPGYEPLR